MKLLSKRASGRELGREEVHHLVADVAEHLHINGKRVLIIIPDGTRSMPMPLMFDLCQQEIARRAAVCDYLVALGTHQPMDEAQLSRHLGAPVQNGKYGSARVFNHRWDLPETFADVGAIPASEVQEVSQGLLSEAIHIRINRLIFEYDQVLICGPVFPHEVVGFSGGNKYLFPGISTGEMIHHTHWLGALLGSYNIIGTYDTPVRTLINLAAEKVSIPVACLALVLEEKHIAGFYFGSAREAWKAAAEHAAEVHIQWVERPFQRVLAVMPEMYDDLWTGSKGMYKVEPAMAEGGEVVLYAPHITEASYTHKKYIDQIGYHCCEYFLKQWDRFAEIPRGVIAHSTHLRGQGTYDHNAAVESARIKVTLATGISEERCRNLGLGYADPAKINFDEWRDREAEGIVLLPRAGETLYRLKSQKSTRGIDSQETLLREPIASVSR
ncbi:MAG TPA: lactate racemase domain-containing protein [Terriglobales bacterium]|nr:lactate racemase domain-containing protein [Terriglobales bacterium]